MTTTLNASTAGAGGFIATGDNSGSLALQTAGTTAVTIDTSQKVGIGTTNPSVKLEVNPPTLSGTIQEVFKITDSANSTLAIRQTTTVNDIYANNVLSLSTNGAERARIDSSGNLLVGTTSVGTTSAKFIVSANANTYNILTVQDTSSTYSSGNYFAIFYNNSSASAGTISHPTATTVSYNTSSDARLKTNIVDAPLVLDKVLSAKVRSFDWKEDNHHVEYGFVAQELYEQLPEAVGKGDDAPELSNPKNMWQVEYGRLTPMLVKAIQELKAINDTQAETINALTARVVALESKVGV